METSFPLRIDGNGRHWGGNNSPSGDRQSRRRQKLQALLQCLKTGDLEGSRQAFTALVNFDPSVAGDPYLSKIGAALQSSNVFAAQHFGLELQKNGGRLHLQAMGTGGKHTSGAQAAPFQASGLHRIDLSA